MSINVEWTIDDVSARFVEAAKTDRRLPPVRLPGYASAWPALQCMAPASEKQSEDDRMLQKDRMLRIPPSPAAIERMLETTRWMQWLDPEARHLVWMRANRQDWQEICRRVGYDRTTAWRRWKKALQVVADALNGHKLGT